MKTPTQTHSHQNSKVRSTRLAVGGIVFSLVVAAFLASACAPLPASKFTVKTNNETGFTAADGKQHTGAGRDSELSNVKRELADGAIDPSSLPKGDRELAASVQSARLETLAGSTPTIRVHVLLSETGRLLFDFTSAQTDTKASVDGPNDVRYKYVVGKTTNGDLSHYELALLCRKPTSTDSKAACRVATVTLRDTQGSGARAGIIIRNQDSTILAKSPTPDHKHATLKRLLAEFKTARDGSLQSFEVAWGPSGFALSMNDRELCPVGRLVETNDLDEPLHLNCAGVPAFRDLEGRMIGNTTRGELFLELTATVPGLLYGESTERIYLLVRQKRAAKAPTTSPAPTSPSTPGTSTPPVQTPTPADDDTDPEDDEPVFPDEQKPEPAPAAPKGTGWLVPIDPNSALTKTWMRDRKNPVVDRAMKNWTSGRMRAFATNFLPNRDMILKKLAQQRVPPEFALVTAYESTFFIVDDYPVQVSSAKAVGPWQFMPGTGKGLGLKVFDVATIANPRKKEKGQPQTIVVANPCDDRGHLEKSSGAAAVYIRSLLNAFPNDPRLVLMAYNMGEGGLKRRLTKLQASTSTERINTIKELGLGYWAIRRFNMAPTETLNYVPAFLSAYHAALEMDPITSNAAPWKPNPTCK